MKTTLCITKKPLMLPGSVCGTLSPDASLSFAHYFALFTPQLLLLA